MIPDVDDDGSGTIEYEEFLNMMTHKILNRDPKDEILKASWLFDNDWTGKISFRNLNRVAKELVGRMTDEELQEMIDEADRDGDGEVNEEEFLRIMKTTDEELQETDEADRDGNGEANEEEFMQIMKKTNALRAPSPSGTPRPTAMIKVSSRPERGCNPPNLVDGHSGVDPPPHASEPQFTGCGVSFGEVPCALSTEPCRPRIAFTGDGSVLPTLPCPEQDGDRLQQAGLEKKQRRVQGAR